MIICLYLELHKPKALWRSSLHNAAYPLISTRSFAFDNQAKRGEGSTRLGKPCCRLKIKEVEVRYLS